MRKEVPSVIEEARITHGRQATAPGSGLVGWYQIRTDYHKVYAVNFSVTPMWERLTIMSLTGAEPPKQPDVQWLRDRFFEPTDTVIEFHNPIRAQTKNSRILWRWTGTPLPEPGDGKVE
jgi:hypothetical protein